jgi:hypothetical protein
VACTHDSPTRLVCRHLREAPADHATWFTGHGAEEGLVCRECRGACDQERIPAPVCDACYEAIRRGGDNLGFVGTPQVVDAPRGLRFEHRALALPRDAPRALDAQPICAGDRDAWVIAGDDGRLHELVLDDACELTTLATLPIERVDPARDVIVRLSRDHALAAVANRLGTTGVVIDLATGAVTMEFARDGYHDEHSTFPIAFFERGGRQLLVHGTAWNRLDISDPRTGELLTPRGPTAHGEDGQRPPHFLDYFHCELAIAPDQRHIADNGWVWHPVGIVATWSLDRWLENAWESEDGPSRHDLCQRTYFWDGPWCWLDDRRLAVWGYGHDAEAMLDAVRVFDATTGQEERWFPGPQGELFCDGAILLSASAKAGVAAWDLATGARIVGDPAAPPLARFHPTAKTLLALPAEGRVQTSRLCGHHARAPWLSPRYADLAAAIARDRSWDGLPVLADALEEAGCPDADLLAHCRAPGSHGQRCWAIDRLLP